MGIHLIGTGFAVTVLSSKFKVDDALIGSMASGSKILSSFVYAFSQVEWQMVSVFFKKTNRTKHIYILNGVDYYFR